MVGADLQLQYSPDYQQYLKFREWVRRNPDAIKQSSHAEQKPVDTYNHEHPSVLTQQCGKCHLPDQAEGGVKGDFDLTALTADTTLKAIRKMALGEMPPERKLRRETKNAILDELLEISKPDKEPVE